MDIPTIPSRYVPRCPADFIGDAANYALLVEKLFARAKKQNNASLRFLLNGPPGLGKSSLARWMLEDLLGISKFDTIKLNGTQINIESIEDICQRLQYRPMEGDYRAIWFEECDAMSVPAQKRILTMLDDLDSINGIVVVCTSNCRLKEFEPRFQTRFTVLEFMPPDQKEVEAFLAHFIPNPEDITAIASRAYGNVRQALKDADLAI
jgi:replication-associated recombination protein RarA